MLLQDLHFACFSDLAYRYSLRPRWHPHVQQPASAAAEDHPAVCERTFLLQYCHCAPHIHVEVSGVCVRTSQGGREHTRLFGNSWHIPWPIAMPLHDGSPLPPPAPPAPLPPSAAVVNHLRAVESAQRRRALLHVNEVADRCFRECVTDFGFTKCAHCLGPAFATPAHSLNDSRLIADIFAHQRSGACRLASRNFCLCLVGPAQHTHRVWRPRDDAAHMRWRLERCSLY